MRKQSLQVSWIAVCAIVTVVYFTAIYVAISHIETLAANLGLSGDIGRFVSEKNLNLIGDTLAGIFSPLALIWLVAAVLIQSQELKLQRQEIAENRSVMHDQARAAEAQAEFVSLQTQAMREQLQLQKAVARATYKVSLFKERFALFKHCETYESASMSMTVAQLDEHIFKMSEIKYIFGNEVSELADPSALAAIDAFNSIRKFQVDYNITWEAWGELIQEAGHIGTVMANLPDGQTASADEVIRKMATAAHLFSEANVLQKMRDVMSIDTDVI